MLLFSESSGYYAYEAEEVYDVIPDDKKYTGTYRHWKILCGKARVNLGTDRQNITVVNDFDNFLAYGVYKTAYGMRFKNHSVDMWLEMTKLQ
jgi:hypothetical protein